MRIFLIHSTRDRNIAEALKDLFRNVFGAVRVEVSFSSDQSIEGGIPPGEPWLAWINDQISQANKAYAILTANSITNPWVIWEAGVAAGTTITKKSENLVVPIKFGVTNSQIPSPLHPFQVAAGDTATGVSQLIEDVNQDLPTQRLSTKRLSEKISSHVPGFIGHIQGILESHPSAEALLASIPNAFPANRLEGTWVSCFTFNDQRCHAEISRVIAVGERKLKVVCTPFASRTEGHKTPFSNLLEAEVVNRHFLGHWRNVSDSRYFGSVHLAVLPGEKVMQGIYTSLVDDIRAGSGSWKWVRINPETLDSADMENFILRDPREIYTLLDKHPDAYEMLSALDALEPK